MEEIAQEIVDDSDMIQVQDPVESNEYSFNMDMGLELPSMDLGLNF